ncbi:MAG: MFS transporter [Lautropia sp.]
MSIEKPAPTRILVWMCVIIAINQIGFSALIPVLPLYAQSFGVPASAIGLAISIYGLARFAMAMPGGRLADKLGRRPTLAIGGVVSALGNLWCAYAASFAEFMVARFVAGAGASLVLTIGSVVLADISPPSRRGRMMATYQGTFLFAVGVGPLPGGLLAEAVGLAAPFVVYAVAGVLVGTIAWFAIPETRDYGERGAAAAAQARPGFAAQIRLLWRHTGFVLVSLIGLTNAIARTGALFAIVPLIGSARIGLSAAEIGAGFGIASILGLAASYPAGAVADRHGRKPVIVPATLITGVALLTFLFASSFAAFIAGCVIWGVASSISGAAPAAYAADSAPRGMNAAAMSSYRMLADLGYVFGPVALGALADWASADAALWVAAALVAASGLAFAAFAPETVGRRAAGSRDGDGPKA